MKPIKPPTEYTQMIGIVNTNQFAKMQIMMQPLNELERMEILYNQLKLEIEMEEDDGT